MVAGLQAGSTVRARKPSYLGNKRPLTAVNRLTHEYSSCCVWATCHIQRILVRKSGTPTSSTSGLDTAIQSHRLVSCPLHSIRCPPMDILDVNVVDTNELELRLS